VEKVEQVERCASPCGWISVVALGATSGSVRPFDSTRRDAKRVLMSVDFPSPVCPTTMTLNWKPRLTSLNSIWRVMAEGISEVRGVTTDRGETGQ
jgi:hypothetical protein